MTEVTRPAMADDNGDFISGTAVTKSFIDLAFDEIDDQVHSSTNPTIKPKDITDEVVAARGSMPSLDARLDVSLNEDGTPKSQAGLVTTADLQLVLGSRQVVANGDFDDWTAGPSDAPDNWALDGAGATVERTGPGESDTFTFGAGKYAAKVTRVGNDAVLEQVLIAAADIADYAEVKGRRVSIAAKVRSSIVSHARIVVDDGVTSTASSFHTGDGSTEHLTASHPISASATKLHVSLQALNSNGAAYVGGFQAVFADVAPSDWQPLSHEPSASATRRGVVDVGTQEFEGDKTFREPPAFHAGSSATPAKVNGVIHTDTTTVGNVGAGEDDLMQYTIPANVLDAVGKGMRIICAGVFANNGTNKQIKVYHWGASLDGTENLPYTNKNWYVEFTYIRSGADTIRFTMRWHIGTGATIVATEQYVLVSGVGSIDFTADNLFKLTGTAGANDDIEQRSLFIEVLG